MQSTRKTYYLEEVVAEAVTETADHYRVSSSRLVNEVLRQALRAIALTGTLEFRGVDVE